MTRCRNCGIPEDQFDDDKLDAEWPDGQTHRDFIEELSRDMQRPFCSIGCTVEKLGLWPST